MVLIFSFCRDFPSKYFYERSVIHSYPFWLKLAILRHSCGRFFERVLTMTPTPRTICPSLEDGYVLLVDDGSSAGEPSSPGHQEFYESDESNESCQEIFVDKPIRLEGLNRFLANILLVLCCLLLAVLVSKHVTAAAVPSHEKLVIQNRTAYVYKPKAGSVTAAVLVLHGSQGQASDMFDLGFERLADLHGFYVVYPEMAVPRSSVWGYQHDLSYFSMLATRLREASFGVMPDKLFVCGHSAGGTMTTFLQNEMDDFAAAGVVEAAVGSLQLWNMTRRGHRTILVWNHAFYGNSWKMKLARV